MTQSEPPRRSSGEAPSLSLGLGWGWLSPVLLLSIPAELLTAGRDGLWLLLLVFVAPLLALLLPQFPAPRNHRAGTLAAVLMLLMVGTVLWANLTLAGDVAFWLGGLRWNGVLVAGGGAVALAALGEDERRGWLLGFLAFVGLVGLALPLLVILRATDPVPPRVFSRVASQAAFQFASDSPWVSDGRSVMVRRGVDTLFFEEEHRVIPLTERPMRVIISDGRRVRVEELRVTSGRPVTLRPGDRLQVDGEARYRFEAGKRIPGAPVSGIAWADAPIRPRGVAFLRVLGLGVTLVGGAAALFTLGGSRSRGGIALWGLFLLAAVAWSQCWALYGAAYAPEIFLGGVTPEKLLELPALVLRGQPWGRWLVGVALAGLLAGILAAAAALRRALGQMELAGVAPARVRARGEPAEGHGRGEARVPVPAQQPGVASARVPAMSAAGVASARVPAMSAAGVASARVPAMIIEDGIARDWRLWGGLVALAGLASLWPFDAWTLLSLAFGLGASTLAPLVVAGGRPRAATGAMAVGFVLFVGLSALEWLAPAQGYVLLSFPALIAAPAAWGILWLARRLSPEAE